MREAWDVIVSPVVTEKTTRQMETSLYTFIVNRHANKHEITRAVEALWDVKVEDVRTMRYPGKAKRALLGRMVKNWELGRSEIPQEGRRAARARATKSNSTRRVDSMALKKFRPVTPGARFRTVDHGEGRRHAQGAREVTYRVQLKRSSGGRNHHGRITVRRRGGGATSAGTASGRLQARQARDHGSAGSPPIEYDPNRSASDRPGPLRGRREALHPLRARNGGWRHGDRRDRTPTSAPGNALPLARDSAGNHGAQRRDEAG